MTKILKLKNSGKANPFEEYASSVSNPVVTTQSNLYFYDDFEDQDPSSLFFGTPTIKEKIQQVGNIILNNAKGLQEAKKRGNTIKGNPKVTKHLDTVIPLLENYLASLNNSTEEGSVEDILNFVNNYAIKIFPDKKAYFTNVFRDDFENEPTSVKNLRELTKKGYSTVVDEAGKDIYKDYSYLKNNKYHVLQNKKGDKYIFDKDYNLITDPISNIDTFTNDGVFYDYENGKFYIGTLNKDSSGNIPYGEDLKKDVQNAMHALKHQILPYGKELTWSKYHDAKSADPLVRALVTEKILEDGYKFRDVSNLFQGENKIIAMAENTGQDNNGKNTSIDSNWYNDLQLSSNNPENKKITLYTLEKGKLKPYTFEQLSHLYKREGWGEDNDFSVKKLSDDYNRTARTYRDTTGEIINKNFRMTNNPWTDWVDISEYPLDWARAVVNALKAWGEEDYYRNIRLYDTDDRDYNLTAAKFIKNFNLQDPKTGMAIIDFILRMNKNQELIKYGKDNQVETGLTDEEIKILFENYNALLKAYEDSQSIAYKKGGIMKYQKGKKTESIYNYYEGDEQEHSNINYNNIVTERRDPGDQIHTQDNFWGVDVPQLTALVGDIVSTFSGGWVGAGAGVFSTVLEVVSDVNNDAVSAGEVVGNMFKNLGFAALSFIPGAGAGKLMTKVAKWAPRIAYVAGAYNLLNGELYNSLNKAMKNPSTLTVRDYKNIASGVSSLLGATKGIKVAHRSRNARKAAEPTKYKIDGIEKELTAKQFEDLNKRLNSGDVDKVRSALKSYGVKEENISKFMDVDGVARTWYAPWKTTDAYASLKGTPVNNDLTKWIENNPLTAPYLYNAGVEGVATTMGPWSLKTSYTPPSFPIFNRKGGKINITGLQEYVKNKK